jgi:hypothetical protein
MTTKQTGAAPAIHSPNGRSAILDAQLQRLIGRQLRTVYDDILKEPVPDRFVRLLQELENKQSGDS